MRHPLLSNLLAHGALTLEYTGWLVVVAGGRDRTAAATGIAFHAGIRVCMNIDYLSFWGCSFVFFFVDSISGSGMLAILVAGGRSAGDGTGEEEERKDKGATIARATPERKQRRVSSTAMFVTLLLTFKALRPHDTILPPVALLRFFDGAPDVGTDDDDDNGGGGGSPLDHLWRVSRAMAAKPFYGYTMFSASKFPVERTLPYLVFRRTAAHTGTGRNDTAPSSHNDAADTHETTPPRFHRVQWIPSRASDQYLSTDVLESADDDRYFLYYREDGTGEERVVTWCNVVACLLRRFVPVKEGNGGGNGVLRRKRLWRYEETRDEGNG